MAPSELLDLLHRDVLLAMDRPCVVVMVLRDPVHLPTVDRPPVFVAGVDVAVHHVERSASAWSCPQVSAASTTSGPGSLGCLLRWVAFVLDGLGVLLRRIIVVADRVVVAHTDLIVH